MNAALPLKNLRRLNLLLTTFISLFVSIVLFISDVETPRFIFATFLRAFITIYLLGLSNIFTLHLVQTNFLPSVKKTNLVRYLFSTALSLSIYAILVLLFAYLSGREGDLLDQKIIIMQFIAYCIFNTLTVLMQNQVLLQHKQAQAELENIQLKAAVSEASNFMLRQQIHPHFLFNSLTILKSLYKKDTAKGEFYLTRLANFLRVSLSDHSSRTSVLETELMLCHDYMEMQKIRFGDAIEYDVRVSEQAKTKLLPFFAIQILLENSIKHNMLTEAHPLKICVQDAGNYITVSNNLQARTNKEVSTGLGLANLAERYRLLSGDQIAVNQGPENFSVTIKIYKDENCNH